MAARMTRKHPLSVEDVAKAIATAEGVVKVLVETLYSSGARVSELVGLTWDDVDWAGGYVRLQGKGGDMRIVPLGAPCLAALRAWKETASRGGGCVPDRPPPFRPPQRLPTGLLGASPGPTDPVFSLNAQQVRDRLKTVGRRIGVHLTPHLLRHAFAGHLHLNGANERVIQEWLGHCRVDTTALYLDGCERVIEEKRQLVARSLAAARGLDADPRSLKRVIVGDGAGLILR